MRRERAGTMLRWNLRRIEEQPERDLQALEPSRGEIALVATALLLPTIVGLILIFLTSCGGTAPPPPDTRPCPAGLTVDSSTTTACTQCIGSVRDVCAKQSWCGPASDTLDSCEKAACGCSNSGPRPCLGADYNCAMDNCYSQARVLGSCILDLCPAYGSACVKGASTG